MSIYGTIFTVGDGDSDSSPGRVSSYTDNDPHKIPRRAGKGQWIDSEHLDDLETT